MTNIDIRTGNGEWTYNDYLNEKLNEKRLGNDQTSGKVNTSDMLRTDTDMVTQSNASREQTVKTVIDVLNDKKNLEKYRKDANFFKFKRNLWVAVSSMWSAIVVVSTILQIAPQYNPYHWFTMPPLFVTGAIATVSGFAAYSANREKKRAERDAEKYHNKSSFKDIPLNQI